MALIKIKGIVANSDGSPVTNEGYGVQLLQYNSLLSQYSKVAPDGDAILLTNGSYKLEVDESALTSNETGGYDVVIHLVNTSAENAIIQRSPLLRNIGLSQTVNLAIGSTFEKLQEFDFIQPKLNAIADQLIDTENGNTLKVAEIIEVAKKEDLSVSEVESMVKAKRVKTLLGDISTDDKIYYGLIKTMAGESLPSLFSSGKKVLAEELKKAVANKTINLSSSQEDLENDILSLSDTLVEKAAAMAISTPALSVFFENIPTELTDTDQTIFLSTVLKYDPDGSTDLWTDLQNSEINAEAIAPLKRRAQLNALSGSIQTTQALESLLEDQDFDTLYSISQDSIAVAVSAIPLPDNINKQDGEEDNEAYARQILTKMEVEEPTKFFAGRNILFESEGGTPLSENLQTLFTDYPAFDLLSDNIKTYDFSEGGLAGQNIDDLVIIQNLAKISPKINRFEAAKSLHEASFQSAGDIAKKRRDKFVAEFEGILDEKTSIEIHIRAQNVASQAIAISSRYALATRQPFLKIFQPGIFAPDDSINGIPDLESLFGSLSTCSCKHCQSLLSPAAYMVDMFEWFKEIEVDGSANLYTALSARRPDLKEILLSCDNSNTVMPHIDLAIEILELAVLKIYDPGQISASDYARQTTWKTEQLLALPEYFKTEAYSALNDHVYPWKGMFNFWEYAAGKYLQYLGISYHELVRDLPYHNGADIVDLSLNVESSKRLGLSPLLDMVMRFDTAAMEGYLSGTGTISASSFYNNVSLTTLQNNLNLLLDNTGLTFEELKELLDTAYLKNSDIIFTPGSCDLSEAGLSAFGDTEAKRLAQLYLLHKAIGYSVRETDILIGYAGSLVDSESISGTVELQRSTNLPVAEIASWNNFLSTYNYNDEISFFHSVFANPKKHRLNSTLAGSTVSEAFELNALGDNLADATPFYATIPELKRHILSACRLSVEDYDSLMDFHNLDSSIQQMALDHLSYLYRIGSICRALSISARELFYVVRKTNGIPFTTAYYTDAGLQVNRVNPQTTLEFLKDFELFRSVGLGPEELEYILSNNQVPQFAISQEEADTFMDDLRAYYNSEEFQMGLEGLSISAINSNKQLALFERLSLFLDIEYDIINALLSSNASEEIEIPYSGELFRDYYFSDAFEDGSANPLEGWSSLQILSRILLLINRVKFEAKDIPYFMSGFSDIISIYVGGEYDNSDYESLIRSVKASKINRLKGSDRSVLEILFEFTDYDESDIMSELEKYDEWKGLSSVVESQGFGFGETNSEYQKSGSWFLKTDWLIMSAAALEISKRVGVGFTVVQSWVKEEMDEATLQSITKTVAGKYSVENWPDIGGKIRDEIRIAQRDALAQYVASRSSVIETNDLYGIYNYYLIDTEINPCYMTSRIKQANSSIQLFMQRALMGLENYIGSTITIPKNARREWEWRKNYRVWEANRKVFLYPENWMEPELRDDQTGLYKEMIDELQGGEVTLEHASRVFLNYIEKVSSISDLEIAQFCYSSIEEENGLPKIPDLHVFARSKQLPHTYYYRKYVDNVYWTEWEKLDMEIEGDHIMPVVHNSRLMLFWPSFIKKQVKASEEAGENIQFISAGQDADVIEVHLNWSEYYNGQWGNPKRAKETVIDYHGTFVGFLSAAVNSQNTLEIFVYQDTWNHPGDLNDLRTWFHKPSNSIGSRHKWVFDGCGDSPRVVSDWNDKPNDDNNTYKISSSIYNGVTNQKWIRNKSEVLSYEIGISSYTSQTITINVATPLLNVGDTVMIHNNTNSKYVLERKVTALNPSGGNTIITLDFRLPFTNYINYNLLKVKTENMVGPLEVAVSRGSSLFQHHTDTYRILGPEGYSNKPVNLEEEYVKLLNANGTMPQFLTFPQEAEANMGFYSRGKNHFFFEDNEHTFFVKPVRKLNSNASTYRDLKSLINTGLQDLQIGDVSSQTANLNTLGGANLNQSITDNTVFYTSNDTDKVIDISSGSSYAVNGNILISSDVFTPTELSYDYRFYNFYHHYTCLFKKQINRYGVEGLLNPKTGRSPEDDLLHLQQATELFFKQTYNPTENVIGYNDAGEKRLPKRDIDFDLSSGYGIYNWEIFYHAPLHIATELMNNQKFSEAQKWFHYIFDPTETDDNSPERYWKLKPFYELAAADAVSLIQEDLDADNAGMERAIKVWRKNPFKPYAVGRLRTESFMMDTVMKYLDNLIAWGDHLFTRDTMESIGEASQIYALAAQILGRKPVEVDKDDFVPQAYDDLGNMGTFSNATVEIEKIMPLQQTATLNSFEDGDVHPIEISQNYFCIPRNEMLWKYWDIVADRLFKIRNCLNIQGIFRQLPLFEPPIDPALLVKAAAAGLSISSALDLLNAPNPHYRYGYLYQKALDLVNDVKTLGSMLLSALEKKDAEELSLLRVKHEEAVMDRLVDIRKSALDEAKANLDATISSKAITEHRQAYYSSREYMNTGEKVSVVLSSTAIIPETIAGVLDGIGIAVLPIPKITGHLQAIASGVSTEIVDGRKIQRGLSIASTILRTSANIMRQSANLAGTMGSYDRRQDDWNFQAEAAEKEIAQIEKQIISAEIRKAYAEKELDNQKRQEKESKETKAFMEDKFTNNKLYSWMVKEVSKLYFSAYNMAFDLAKMAEKAHFREVEIENASSKSYIEFGHWDNLKKGLLAGEGLHQDLKRLDIAHIEKNERMQEITKQVSLAILDPQALVNLREKGIAYFDIPELWYDLDYPGHYKRTIKSVALTIPCVTGPYTTVNATLTLTDHYTRLTTDTGSGYPRVVDDGRFRIVEGMAEQISASTAQNDAGVFELNFNDPRYLPFEGAGAISRWRLELPHNIDLSNGNELASTESFRQFDYESISDVIMTIRYTSSTDGSLKTAALENLSTNINMAMDEVAGGEDGLWRVISLKREFPTEYHRFLTEADGNNVHELNFTLGEKYFPHIFRGKSLNSREVEILIVPKEGAVSSLSSVTSSGISLQKDSSGSGTYTLYGDSFVATDSASDADWGGVGVITQGVSGDVSLPENWKLILDADGGNMSGVQINGSNLIVSNEIQRDLLDDILIAIRYKKA